MRRAVAGLLCLALAAGAAPAALAQEDQQTSVAEAMAAVGPYTSTWDAAARDIGSLTVFTDSLTDTRRQYQAWRDVLQTAAQDQQTRVAALTERVAQLQQQQAATAAALGEAQRRQAEQERVVGALARLLYQQPAPELSAVEQVLEGRDLRSFERQDLVTSVLTANSAELDEIRQSVQTLQQQLDATVAELTTSTSDLASATQRNEALATQLSVADQALTAIELDRQRAQEVIDQIRAEEEARIREQAAAAAAAAAAAEAAAQQQAAAASIPAARPTGGGTPAKSSDNFSAKLPAAIPFRDAFLTYGIRYRVEPALLAAIASQESGFNPWAGCQRVGAGKGIMQHENQPQYCGPDAVEASIEKSAIMLASYYNRTGSWTAAVFAYNNGPGLMDEWVDYSSDKDALLRVLSDYYNRQPYASPGPVRGYATWGEWRARVAYSYAAPVPEPGFHSATEKWLIYRQG